MIDVLNALIEWDCEQGWNEAPCWKLARKVRDRLVAEREAIANGQRETGKPSGWTMPE